MIATFLLTESKNPDSIYTNFQNILPKDFSEFPLHFDDKSLLSLEGSPLKTMVQKAHKSFTNDYDIVCDLIDGFKFEHSYKDFCNALIICQSRLFSVFIDGDKQPVLVPFADMFNHVE